MGIKTYGLIVSVLAASLHYTLAFAAIDETHPAAKPSIQTSAIDGKPQVIPRYTMSAYDNDVKMLYKNEVGSLSSDIETRIITDSGYFLRKPYLLGALGEGPIGEFDQNPLYRTDKFDCVTYVSTVLALAESKNFDAFTRNIIKVNYHDGQPSFLSRNHFMSTDWNPANQRNGYLKDVTKTLFPEQYKVARTLIDKPNWFRKLPPSRLNYFVYPSSTRLDNTIQNLHDLSTKTEKVHSHLNYIPLSALYTEEGKPRMELFNRIPSPVVIEIVRPNWDLRALTGTRMDVSHVGIGIRVNGKLIYRNASSQEMAVIDTPLTQYLAKYLNSPTVKGIHIEKIVANYS